MCKPVRLPFISLVIIFTFCQVIGVMCALPDLSEAQETAILVEENIVCPMDGASMCPPSLTASPARQMKNIVVVINPVPSPLNHTEASADVSGEMVRSWSSAYSIVPLSISSSSVLRI